MQTAQAPAAAAATAGEAAAERAAPAAAPAPAPVAPKHVGGIGLGLSAIWALIKNFFRRLFGGGKSPT
jgi:hypothetical protein